MFSLKNNQTKSITKTKRVVFPVDVQKDTNEGCQRQKIKSIPKTCSCGSRGPKTCAFSYSTLKTKAGKRKAQKRLKDREEEHSIIVKSA